jgi:hypothetical protein
MKQKTLNEILEKHALWLQNKPGGIRADLYKADLREANLSEADLRRANLYKADLRRANLYKADLREANLSEANLSEADLYKADLREANLWGADLREADLRSARNIPFVPIACPCSGSFIAWKKAYSLFGEAYLVKLLIPDDARRSSATGRKCRADKAEVLSIEPIESVPVIVDKVRSKYDSNFYYQVGQRITIPDFDPDRFHECAPGIHFFINKQEAIEYYF